MPSKQGRVFPYPSPPVKPVACLLARSPPVRNYVSMSATTDRRPKELPPLGLVISATESIRSFLLSASKDLHLAEELRELAADLASLENVPYKSLRSVWMASSSEARPDLVRLFSGSGFVFTSPKPREKSEELKARLTKLAEIAEKKAYEELVKDIKPKTDVQEPFSSYKDQLGFGLHVVAIMFTCYLLGYFAFRALFSHNPVLSATGGILGMVFGMLLETLRFIIWTSKDITPRPSTSRIKKNQ